MSLHHSSQSALIDYTALHRCRCLASAIRRFGDSPPLSTVVQSTQQVIAHAGSLRVMAYLKRHLWLYKLDRPSNLPEGNGGETTQHRIALSQLASARST